jgi:hypothetical protein
MLSAGGVPPVSNPIGGHPSDGAIGSIAALKQHATTLLQCTIQAAAVARDAAADAADINNAHATIVSQHHKMFLAHAFGINPDGTPIINPSLLLEKNEDVQVRQLCRTLQLHNRSPHQLG